MSVQSTWRPLEPFEKRILEKLLECEFPGGDELQRQLEFLSVQTIDKFGSLELRVASPILAEVSRTVPVEAEYLDEDGVPVWILLHVREGQLCELELLKADGSSIRNPPRAELFVAKTFEGPNVGGVKGYQGPQ